MSALGVTVMKARLARTYSILRPRKPVRRVSCPLPSILCELGDDHNAAPTSSMEALCRPRRRSKATISSKSPTRTYRCPSLASVESGCGAFHLMDTFFATATSRLRTMAQLTVATELSLARGIQPAADKYIYSFDGYNTTTPDAQYSSISQVNLMAYISSRTPSTAVADGLTLAQQQLKREAAATGKAVVTHKEAHAIRAAAFAKYQQHLSPQQVNLAATDTAARKAASGLGVCSGAAGGVVSMTQRGFLGHLGDCGLHSLEQEQLGCRKKFQFSAAAEAGGDRGIDDVDGMDDQQ